MVHQDNLNSHFFGGVQWILKKYLKSLLHIQRRTSNRVLISFFPCSWSNSEKMEDGEPEIDHDLDIDELSECQYGTTINPKFKWRERESRNSRWSH